MAEDKAAAAFTPHREGFGIDDLDPTGFTSRDVLLGLGPSTTDPCEIVQLSIYGQRAAANWWATAFAGEWSFGFPLSVADLDPTAPTEEEPPIATELIIASETASERPIVPLTGSCDGLPDAPPHTGPGPALAGTIPDDLLAGFLETFSHPEVNLPATGYTEVTIDDTRISWVIGYEDIALIVIDAVRTGQEWTIEQWSTSACCLTSSSAQPRRRAPRRPSAH